MRTFPVLHGLNSSTNIVMAGGLPGEHLGYNCGNKSNLTCLPFGESLFWFPRLSRGTSLSSTFNEFNNFRSRKGLLLPSQSASSAPGRRASTSGAGSLSIATTRMS